MLQNGDKYVKKVKKSQKMPKYMIKPVKSHAVFMHVRKTEKIRLFLQKSVKIRLFLKRSFKIRLKMSYHFHVACNCGLFFSGFRNFIFGEELFYSLSLNTKSESSKTFDGFSAALNFAHLSNSNNFGVFITTSSLDPESAEILQFLYLN